MPFILFQYYSISILSHYAAAKTILLDILSLMSSNQYQQMQAIPPVYVAAKSF